MNIQKKRARGKKNIYAYFWFDIEDYVTPESNELPIKAFNILGKYKVPVTCKMVAEKVRFLKENNREDIISAIGEHDVGYHMDTHSRHPTLYEYVANSNLVEGAEEFESRERAGLELVEETFKQTPSCFGHAGPAWAPHVYPAMQKMEIPVYLDETAILNVDDGPYWYCGVLNLNGANKNFLSFDYTFQDPHGNEALKRKFKKIHDGLKKRNGGGGGAISLLFHLHTAINKEYWDAVNFADGKNTPKSDYVRPTSQPPEVARRAWEDFEKFVEYTTSFGDVQFITGTDARKIYRRKLNPVVPLLTIKEIARVLSSTNRISYLTIGNEIFFSPSQAFCALSRFAAAYSRNKKIPKRIAVSEPLGPMGPFTPKEQKSKQLSSASLLVAAENASKFIDHHGYLPSSVIVDDSTELAPSDFLSTLAALVLRLTSGKPLRDYVTVHRAKMILDELVDESVFYDRACRWKVLPQDFKAPKILEQIKLQTWTIVPVIPARK